MTSAVIETHGLRKRFGDKLAVADLSLSVREGEVFGFLGPNGAGKTTSLKMLLGLVEPTSGRGDVLGRPLGDRVSRAKLGFLPEHFRFQEWLTGREMLRFHGRLYGLAGRALEARVEALLGRVDLLDAAHRPIRTYSKGMMQRAGLAQAMLNAPRVVFLDEPTSGLDPIGRLLVRDIIRELKREGTAVFLNSHLLGEVEATCDRVVFVKQGRSVHEMAMAGAGAALDVELRLGEAGPATLAALSRFGPVERGEPGPRAAADAAAAEVVRVRVTSEAELPALARCVVERGVPLYGMHAARKSLEQWFLEVMGEGQRPG